MVGGPAALRGAALTASSSSDLQPPAAPSLTRVKRLAVLVQLRDVPVDVVVYLQRCRIGGGMASVGRATERLANGQAAGQTAAQRASEPASASRLRRDVELLVAQLHQLIHGPLYAVAQLLLALRRRRAARRALPLGGRGHRCNGGESECRRRSAQARRHEATCPFALQASTQRPAAACRPQPPRQPAQRPATQAD